MTFVVRRVFHCTFGNRKKDGRERGGLASYGATDGELGRQAARLVDKILKGAQPADLPVEQPTKFST